MSNIFTIIDNKYALLPNLLSKMNDIVTEIRCNTSNKTEYNKLMSIDGIGIRTTESIIDYFSDNKNNDYITIIHYNKINNKPPLQK